MEGIIGGVQNSAQAATSGPAPIDINSLNGSPVTPGAPTLSGTDLGTKSNGFLDMPGTPLSDAASSNIANGQPAVGSGIPSLTASANDVTTVQNVPGSTLLDLSKAKEKVGKFWDSLSPQSQAEVLKSVLAIPGGIQNQRNFDAQMDLARQKLKQTSYANDLPTFGIIAKAQKASSKGTGTTLGS